MAVVVVPRFCHLVRGAKKGDETVNDASHQATIGTPPTQDEHSLAIETPLGKDILLLTALDGVETVSRGFVYTIETITRAADGDVRRLLGKPVTLWLCNDNPAERRPLHGHIRQLTRIAVDSRGYWLWRAEVVPWFWFLNYSVDCRIYQISRSPRFCAASSMTMG